MVRKRSCPAVSHCGHRQPIPNLLPRISTHDLELHGLAIKLNRPDLEVDTDRGDVALGVCVVRESKEQARLPDAGVSDEQQLEQVVISVVSQSAVVAITQRMTVRAGGDSSCERGVSLVVTTRRQAIWRGVVVGEGRYAIPSLVSMMSTSPGLTQTPASYSLLWIHVCDWVSSPRYVSVECCRGSLVPLVNGCVSGGRC
jgi:hypothetical protein